MSLNEQLIDDMKSLILSHPENLIKLIESISVENTEFSKYRYNLIDSIKQKLGDIDFHKFCQVNGFEPITDNNISVGDIVLMGQQDLWDESNEFGTYTVSLRTVEKKLSENFFVVKIIVKANFIRKYNDKWIEHVRIWDNHPFAENIKFHDDIYDNIKGWGKPMEDNDCIDDEDCDCDKIYLLRKKK